MIGTLGPVVFEASTERVRTFESLARTTSARYQKHDIISKKPVLEYIGPDVDGITLPMSFNVQLGLNPVKEITALRNLCHNGNRLELVIGGRFIGDFVIKQISDTWERVDNKGNLFLASVNVTLEESIAE